MRRLTEEEWALWQLGVTDGVGPATVRGLIDHFGSATAVCRASRAELAEVQGVGTRLQNALKNPSAQTHVRDEYQLIESVGKHSTPISPVFVGQEGYPEILSHCMDAPIVLYVRGTLPTDQPMVAVVGTRHSTTYSEEALRHLIGKWAQLCPDLVIVSGLAYGVDATAHSIALEHGLRTVAVVAHGHYTLYPSQHADLARRIVENGGAIVTEYTYYTRALPQRFVSRNRIVAGMSIGTVVVESRAKGGALITADLAFDYGRGVYAIPGRIFDATSEGCNLLIQRQKASIVSDPESVLRDLNIISDRGNGAGQPLPFDDDEAVDDPILNLLSKYDQLSLEDLSLRLGETVAAVSARLFELELDDRVRTIPGGRYAIKTKLK